MFSVLSLLSRHMDLMQAIGAFRDKSLDFHSRSMRSEFWWVQLVYTLLLFVVFGIDGALGYDADSNLTPATTAFELIVLVPMAALTARRLHDVGLTGWAQVPLYLTYITYIPGYEDFIFNGAERGGAELVLLIVYAVYSIWILLNLIKDSQPGNNRYGPNPKDPNLSDVFD